MLTALADRFDPPKIDVFAILGYHPSARQQVFHDAPEFDVLYGGAAGGGKTKALLMHGLRAAVWHPGIRVGAFRRTFDELEESLLKELASVGFAEDLGASWNAGKHVLSFPNSSVIRFRYLENIQDATRRQGGEYQLVLLDERTLIPPQAVGILVDERIRTGQWDVPVLGVRSGTNPGGIGHGDVRTRFIEGTDNGAKRYTDDQGRTVRFIPAKVSDNPYLERADPGYIRRLEGIKDPARRKAMKDGDWNSFAGQVFGEWDYERHIIPRFTIPPEWMRHTGVDYGYAAPWCALTGAVDNDGRLWLYREEYDTQVGEQDQAKRILAGETAEQTSWTAAQRDTAAIVRHADPAMWAKLGTALPVASAYAIAGCGLVKADNDRLNGWQRLHTFLADGPACGVHRDEGLSACPMLHVLDDSCPNLVRTLPNLPYDPNRVEDVDTKAEDHAADALRYLVMGVGSTASLVFDEDGPGATAPDGTELLHEIGGGVAMRHADTHTPIAAAVITADDDTPRGGGTRRSPWAS